MKSYPVKENHIGSAVSKILRYNHTDKLTNKQTDILLLYYEEIYTLLAAFQTYLSIFLFLSFYFFPGKEEGVQATSRVSGKQT